VNLGNYVGLLRQRGIILTCRDGRLVVDAPRGSLVDDNRDTLRQWRDELVLYVSSVTPPLAAGVALANANHNDQQSATPRDEIPPAPAPLAATPVGTIVGPCSRCGQPSRIRCAYQGRPGVWLAWCDSPTCGRADVVDEAMIRRGAATANCPTCGDPGERLGTYRLDDGRGRFACNRCDIVLVGADRERRRRRGRPGRVVGSLRRHTHRRALRRRRELGHSPPRLPPRRSPVRDVRRVA
jgi:hypothetical protein